MTGNNIPYGYCHCGCGQQTTIPTKSDKAAGRIKGQPMRYVQWHRPPYQRTKKLVQQATEYRQWWRENAEVPYGYCWCGCGAKTQLAPRTSPALGWVSREPVRYLNTHFPSHQRELNAQHQYDVVDTGFSTPCWMWCHGKKPNGYAQMYIGQKKVYAHRLYYERAKGPIPANLELDHLCRIRACVNPEHLEAVTHVENVRRGERTKLCYEQAQEIRRHYANGGYTYRQLAQMYGVANGTIRYIIRNEGWL